MPMTPGRSAGSAALAANRVGRYQLRVSVMIARLLARHRDPVLRRTRLKTIAATALEQGHDADAQ